MTIADIRKAIATPQFYELPIDVGILAGTDNKTAELILSRCKETKDGVVLPIKKLYGLEVPVEEMLQEKNDKIQSEAAQSLERLQMAIAEQTGTPVADIETSIKTLVSEGFNITDLPYSWWGFFPLLRDCINRLLRGNGDVTTVSYLLKTRLDPNYDWDKAELGTPLVDHIYNSFVIPEQGAWQVAEPKEKDLGESSIKERIRSLEEKLSQLIIMQSSSTSKPGESLNSKPIETSAVPQPA